jgi:hypothetical protein
MSITINKQSHNVFGTKTAYLADLALDSAYATGGYAFDPEALFGIHYPEFVSAVPIAGVHFKYDSTNKKLLAYRSSLAVQEYYSNVLGSANTDAVIADADDLPTNGALIAAAETQANIVTALGVLVIAVQPDYSRNVCICVDNDSGGPLNLYVGSTSFLVTGTFKGAAQTETISLTVTNDQKAVATTKHRHVYGVKPFTTITSIVQTAYATDKMANGLKISAGLGSKIALLNPLRTPAAADIFHADINGTAYDASALVNTTYNTVNMAALADNDDIMLSYCTPSYGGESEVPNGTDLSAITSVPIIIIGA